MSASDLEVLAILVPNPQFNPPSTNALFVNQTYGFNFEDAQHIRTLSPTNPNQEDVIQGLLYVPDLATTDPCRNTTAAYLPANVTRKADFPVGQSHPLVAIAPWTTIDCSQNYLAAMQADDVRGAVFFQPNTGSGIPPPVSDPSWSLDDGGHWLSENNYPIYAIPGTEATSLLGALAAYSGNITSAPNGTELVTMYDARNYVRLYMKIDVSGRSTGIPSLWVFLIIVLAVLLAVVLITSCVMHLIQGRHRRSLQRRFARGEVDLDALGIKILNVPQQVLNKMPQYIYTSKADQKAGAEIDEELEKDMAGSSTSTSGKATDSPPKSKPTTLRAANGPTRYAAFAQSTCAICLDDFVSTETLVRELPCNHIFHPECIDPFLRNNSSLCPMCKKSALPPGFCPAQVTNFMVRRERRIRRMHNGVRVIQASGGESDAARRASILANYRAMVHARRRSEGLDVERQPQQQQQLDTGTELSTLDAGNTASTAPEITASGTQPDLQPEAADPVPIEQPPPEIQIQGTSARRAWMREHLARRQIQNYERQTHRIDETTDSWWRKILRPVLPNL